MAQLCALRLLRDLPPVVAERGRVKCVSFAAPPLGNSALANTVARKGWSGLFYNLALPGIACLHCVISTQDGSFPFDGKPCVLQI